MGVTLNGGSVNDYGIRATRCLEFGNLKLRVTMTQRGIQLTVLGKLVKAPKRIARKLRSLVRGTPPAQLPAPSYDADHLMTWHKTLDFLTDPQFVSAYQRGMDSGHRICRAPGSKTDIHIEWRVHVILWAAWQASKLEGDFVECGVNTGIYSLAVCDYLDFNRLNKSFFLFDTFAGIPDEQINDREKELGRLMENEVWYEDCYETARRNFAPFPRAVLVRGKVPDTLTSRPIGKVCYLSIDMNIVEPERAAIEFFWDKLSPGAPVVLDDYGWAGFVPQKEAMDEFAAKHGVKILTLPTGQGLLLKPPV